MRFFAYPLNFLLSDKWFIFKEKTIIFFFFLKKRGTKKYIKKTLLYFIFL